MRCELADTLMREAELPCKGTLTELLGLQNLNEHCVAPGGDPIYLFSQSGQQIPQLPRLLDRVVMPGEPLEDGVDGARQRRPGRLGHVRSEPADAPLRR